MTGRDLVQVTYDSKFNTKRNTILRNTNTHHINKTMAASKLQWCRDGSLFGGYWTYPLVPYCHYEIR